VKEDSIRKIVTGRFMLMKQFELVSEYQPTGDQPQAIEQLVNGFKEGNWILKEVVFV
jgi:hypothetical protein